MARAIAEEWGPRPFDPDWLWKQPRSRQIDLLAWWNVRHNTAKPKTIDPRAEFERRMLAYRAKLGVNNG